MAFRTLIINKHSKISYKNNHLVYKAEDRLEHIHIGDIYLLILETTDISITTALISKLTEQNIPIIFCDNKRMPAAHLMPYYGRHDSTLTINKQLRWTDDKKTEAWTSVVKQKIHNQSLLLLDIEEYEKASTISNLLDKVKPGDSTNREGHAAKTFFSAVYGENFTRSGLFAVNEINAALDYGYTLLLSVFAREICKCGCLTQIGINHRGQFNQFNFASDIMEPFRPLIDKIVYSYQKETFPIIKRHLFEIFNNQYEYKNANMYLNNIAEQYTRQIISFLNEESDEIPTFKI